TPQDYSNSNLAGPQWDKLFYHAQESAKLAASYPGLPMGTTQIILEHHGHPQGRGFLYPPNSSLGLHSKIFIIAEELALGLLRFQLSRQKGSSSLLAEVKIKYYHPWMLEALSAFQQALSKSKV
ncbi:MAG: hypothetical protein WCG27_09885, partial [Pseudomonadota bacterium]